MVCPLDGTVLFILQLSNVFRNIYILISTHQIRGTLNVSHFGFLKKMKTIFCVVHLLVCIYNVYR